MPLIAGTQPVSLTLRRASTHAARHYQALRSISRLRQTALFVCPHTPHRAAHSMSGDDGSVYVPRPLPSTLRHRVQAQANESASRSPSSRVTSPQSSPSAPQPSAERPQFTRALPEVPYGLPSTPLFEEERLGQVRSDWLRDVVPAWRDQVSQTRYLPNKDDFWASPAHEALFELAARGQPYHDTLKVIMEHSYFFLFEAVMLAEDAPLPHVMYEDFMKCLSFASLQKAPEEQFALSTTLLKRLLCLAACTCTVDRHYFTSAQQLFRRLEQQQPQMGSELLSAWVYVCTAAGQLGVALDYAHFMSRHGLQFDAEVFAFMMHPSVNIVHVLQGNAPHVAKGLVVQQRLCGRLQATTTTTTTPIRTDHRSPLQQRQQVQSTTTASVALHAMFVYHILTLQHSKKWELVRLASLPARMVPMLPRTRQLAVSLFASEKGLRCGPRSTKALVVQLAEAMAKSAHEATTTAADLLYVLLRTRVNESLPGLAALPKTAFVDTFEYAGAASSAEAEATDDAAFVLQHVRRRRGSPLREARMAPRAVSEKPADATSAWDVAAPLVEALLFVDETEKKDTAGPLSDVEEKSGRRGMHTLLRVNEQEGAAHRGPQSVLAALKAGAQPTSPWPEAAAVCGQLLDRVSELDGLALARKHLERPQQQQPASVCSLETLASVAANAVRSAENRAHMLQAVSASAPIGGDADAKDTHRTMPDAADAVAEVTSELHNWQDLLSLLESGTRDTVMPTHTQAPRPRPAASDDRVLKIRSGLPDESLQYYVEQQSAAKAREDFIASFASQAWIDPSSGRDFLK